MIASGRTDAAYRSVEEVPAGLRRKLLQSTTGVNSGTILIADRRGREELVKAVGNLPASVQERWLRAVSSAQGRRGGCSIPARYGSIAFLAAAITLLSLCLALAGK